MKKILLTLILITISISVSFAQEITGKWYSYLKSNGLVTLWTYEFLPNGKFKMSMSGEIEDKDNGLMTIKYVSGYSGTYTRLGKALSVKGDKKTIHTEVDVICSQKLKDAMAASPQLKKSIEGSIAQTKSKLVKQTNAQMALPCDAGTSWQITRLTEDVWNSITANGERDFRVRKLMSYDEYQEHVKSMRTNIEIWDKSEPTYVVVDKMPQFVGGTKELDNYLESNLRYPEIAKEKGIEGRVICKFVINKNGRVVDVKVERSGGDESLDREAVRLISEMPRWIPGKLGGETVRVEYTLPVKFSLK